MAYEIHFNHPDMPVFPYHMHLRYDVMLKQLPFWIMLPGQSMSIPYTKEMYAALLRWQIARQKVSKTSKRPPYKTRLAPEFWKVSLAHNGQEIIITKHADNSLSSKPDKPNVKQTKIAALQRLIVGFGMVSHRNFAGVGGLVDATRKVEKLTGKKFEWEFPEEGTVRIWRVL